MTRSDYSSALDLSSPARILGSLSFLLDLGLWITLTMPIMNPWHDLGIPSPPPQPYNALPSAPTQCHLRTFSSHPQHPLSSKHRASPFSPSDIRSQLPKRIFIETLSHPQTVPVPYCSRTVAPACHILPLRLHQSQ